MSGPFTARGHNHLWAITTRGHAHRHPVAFWHANPGPGGQPRLFHAIPAATKRSKDIVVGDDNKSLPEAAPGFLRFASEDGKKCEGAYLALLPPPGQRSNPRPA